MPCWDHKKADAKRIGLFAVPLFSPSPLRGGPPGDTTASTSFPAGIFAASTSCGSLADAPMRR